jgi:hypothetical protein
MKEGFSHRHPHTHTLSLSLLSLSALCTCGMIVESGRLMGCLWGVQGG